MEHLLGPEMKKPRVAIRWLANLGTELGGVGWAAAGRGGGRVSCSHIMIL
jgi:hypothetical protein